SVPKRCRVDEATFLKVCVRGQVGFLCRDSRDTFRTRSDPQKVITKRLDQSSCQRRCMNRVRILLAHQYHVHALLREGDTERSWPPRSTHFRCRLRKTTSKEKGARSSQPNLPRQSQ